MEKATFTKYQVFIIAILAFIQFTVILDFMVLSPLGPFLVKELNISTAQFSAVVSAYAFSAGASSILAAGFADKFDRKKMLLFFYAGFVLGTLFCAIAPTYNLLLAARIVTGIFGGVIGSVAMAIISDIFAMQVRGRVMGFVQTAFAASQVFGLPLGLYLANVFNWHVPFYAIVAFSVPVGILILIYMRPITSHIEANRGRNPFDHLWRTATNSNYLRGFIATTLLATGGYMMMPFGTVFATNNLGIDIGFLPVLYIITGAFTVVMGPIIGRLSDKVGKFRMFLVGSLLTIGFVGVYTQLGLTPVWLVVALNIVMFAGISSRMISAQALLTAVPEPQDRGAFMSINASVQQLAGGIASMVAGLIVFQPKTGPLQHYPTLGFVVIGSMIAAIFLMLRVDRMVKRNPAGQQATKIPEPEKPIDADLLDQGIAVEEIKRS